MKAVRIFEHGGTEVLRYDDYPAPELTEDGVLVRVLATSLSSWDIGYRRGAWLENGLVAPLAGRRMFPLPMQLGRDAVGVVEAVGPGVTRFAAGQRVVSLPHPENPHCRYAKRGLGNLSTGIDLPGHVMFGGHAQYVVRPESYWAPLPHGVDPQKAAAAMWSYATAHRVVADRLQVRLNDTILVTGTSGGMGSAAAELALLAGARVIGVTRAAAKVAGLKAIGVDHVVVIGSETAAAVAEIRDITEGEGVDSAVDFTGKPATMRLCFDSMRLGGTFVPGTAEWTRDPLPISALDMIRIEPNIRGLRGSRLDDQRIVLELLAAGRINPRIHAVMPLSHVREAHYLLEGGSVEGRIVLDPAA